METHIEPRITDRPPAGSGWSRFVRSPWLKPLNDPAAIDDLLGLVNPAWSISEVRARVVEARREAPGVRTLVLEPNRFWNGHVAGQHVDVTVEIGGRRCTRTFSLSSAPVEQRIAITVKKHENGKVSAWWNDRATVGDVVTLSQARGAFVLPPSPERIVMLSAGSGITPVMAMLRTLASASDRTSMLFVHCAHSADDVIFADELRTIAAANPRVDLRLFLSREGGRMTTEHLAEIASVAGSTPVYACGPASFLSDVRSAWQRTGNDHALHFEWFGAPVATAPVGAPQSVQAERSGTRFVVQPGETLLVAAENAGLRPVSGCRAGICHTCKCRKISGVTEDLRDGRLSEEPGEMIQLCISTPRSPVTLEL